METEINKIKHGFNEFVQECHATASMSIDTLSDEIRDILKETEDALVSVAQKLKD